jgi:vacuolar-type H+-ATPase subunit D/Vma8
MPEQVPPGRAGRLWLVGRLATARRGKELLDRKWQLLEHDARRLALRRSETRQAWENSYAEAQRWGRRSAVLGGQSGLSLAANAVSGRALVDVKWRDTMGIRHPDDSACSLPVLDPAEIAAGNAALRPAARAYRRAIEAALSHAIAETAFQRIDEELRATKRRTRAIERHRLPALEEALRELQLRLDELELEERVVGRWSRQRHLDTGSTPPTPAGRPDTRLSSNEPSMTHDEHLIEGTGQ